MPFIHFGYGKFTITKIENFLKIFLKISWKIFATLVYRLLFEGAIPFQHEGKITKVGGAKRHLNTLYIVLLSLYVLININRTMT